jgi:hypothetical protein
MYECHMKRYLYDSAHFFLHIFFNKETLSLTSEYICITKRMNLVMKPIFSRVFVITALFSWGHFSGGNARCHWDDIGEQR